MVVKVALVCLLLLLCSTGALALDRKLLGTLTVSATNGVTYAWQGKVSTDKVVTTDPSGEKKVSTGYATGTALGVNSLSCLKSGANCDKPTATVDTAVLKTQGAATGLTATADAAATGNKLTRATTHTGSKDVAVNPSGKTSATAAYKGSSSSTQINGRPASASSSGQANAFAGFLAALATATGNAAANPTGSGHTKSNVDVKTSTNTP